MIDWLLATRLNDTKCLIPLSKISYIIEEGGITFVYLLDNITVRVKETVREIATTI